MKSGMAKPFSSRSFLASVMEICCGGLKPGSYRQMDKRQLPCSHTSVRFRMLYAVPIHSRMPTLCKIAAWPYQCLLTQNADRCSRAAGILARARLLLVVAMIIRGYGPNQLCESIEPISARERCLKNNAPPASRLLRCSCAGGCPRQVTAAHVERPRARQRPGRSPGGPRAPLGPIGRLRVAASGCQRLRHPRRPSEKKTCLPTRAPTRPGPDAAQ